MVQHLVWFKLKENVTEEVKLDMLAALRKLPGAIEGIEQLACGEDFSERSRGFQMGLVVRFNCRAALDAYGPHPVHQAFVAAFKPHWDDVMALDFEE